MATNPVTPTPDPTPAQAPVAVATVPVSNPAHPSHAVWLDILTKILAAAIAIGPAVVEIVDPKDADEAAKIGKIATIGLGATGVDMSLSPGA